MVGAVAAVVVFWFWSNADREAVTPTLEACLYFVSKFRLRGVLWLLCSY